MKRKRFSEEQIVGILQEADAGTSTVSELCKHHGVSEQSFYRWKKRYGGMEVADVRRLRELEKENAKLKQLLAERCLEVDALREVLKKKD
jgi:putative transposase